MSSNGVILQHRAGLLAYLFVDRSDNLLIGNHIESLSPTTGDCTPDPRYSSAGDVRFRVTDHLHRVRTALAGDLHHCGGRGQRAGARTLFIIDDATLKSLGSTIVAKMMDEVKSIFSFAPKFTVLMTTPDKIPEKIDFTDSIVKVVATDNDVTTMQNRARRWQPESRLGSDRRYCVGGNRRHRRADLFGAKSFDPEGSRGKARQQT